MANKKISQLTAGSSVGATDKFEIETTTPASKNVTAQMIAAFVAGTLTTLPTSNEKAALDAANAPSVGNPFATIADIGAGGIGGSGTTGFAPKFTGATTVGNSQFKDTSGVYPKFTLYKSDLTTPIIHFGTDFTTNLFIGFNAGAVNNSGGGAIDNTFVGYNAGAANTLGTLLTIVGKRAGEANTTGSNNTYVGAGSGLSNISGSNNNGFGYHSLMANKGSDNGAFGTFALLLCDTGASNNAFGKSALQNLTSGLANNAYGLECLIQNNGNLNCGYGQQVLYANTAGGNNSAFGSSAGYYNTGSGNAFFGYKSGYYETGSNKLFIDNDARASEADGRLKALIYGVFDAATANQEVWLNAASIYAKYLPTSSVGLASGRIWNNSNVLNIV